MDIWRSTVGPTARRCARGDQYGFRRQRDQIILSLPTLPAGGLLAGATAVSGTVWGVGTRSDYVNGNLTDRTLTMRGTGT